MAILTNYLPLCWFRKNPYQLQESTAFLKHNLIVYFIVEFLLQANMTDDPIESFYEVIFETLLTLVFIAVMLALNGTFFAFVRIATAFIFCANAVSFVIIPVLVWLTISENTFSYYLVGLLLFWEYLLVTYLLKHTLKINVSASLVLSTFYFAFSYYGAFALGQMI